jgi:hypothetical protein
MEWSDCLSLREELFVATGEGLAVCIICHFTYLVGVFVIVRIFISFIFHCVVLMAL